MSPRASFESIFRRSKDADAALVAVQRVKDLKGLDSAGKTLLGMAAYYGHVDACAWLLDHGAAIDAKDEDGRAPLVLALGSLGSHYSVNELWLSRTVNLLIDRGANANLADEEGRTPLHLALEVGWLSCGPEIVDKLLARGADAHVRDAFGEPPVLVAAAQGDLRSLRLLVERGADLHAVDHRGRNALYRVVQETSRPDYERDMPAIVELLLAAEISLETGDTTRGCTLLMGAAYKGNLPLIERCLEAGAALEAKDDLGMTALLWAANGGQPRAVEALLRRGANPTVRTKHGEDVLGLAGTSAPVLEALAAIGLVPAPVPEIDAQGRTRLMRACRDSNLVDVQKALAGDVDINARDMHGKTALVHLLDRNHYGDDAKAIFSLLLARSDLDVGTPTKTGITALHCVCRMTLVEKDMLRALLERKADLQAKAKNGKTPLSLVKYVDPELRALLGLPSL